MTALKIFYLYLNLTIFEPVVIHSTSKVVCSAQSNSYSCYGEDSNNF